MILALATGVWTWSLESGYLQELSSSYFVVFIINSSCLSSWGHVTVLDDIIVRKGFSLVFVLLMIKSCKSSSFCDYKSQKLSKAIEFAFGDRKFWMFLVFRGSRNAYYVLNILWLVLAIRKSSLTVSLHKTAYIFRLQLWALVLRFVHLFYYPSIFHLCSILSGWILELMC